MLSSTSAAQNNPPSDKNIATGQTTNMNERLFSNIVNGNTSSFLPSTSIQYYQCQHVHENSTSYHGCPVYNETPALSAPAHEERANRSAAVPIPNPILRRPVEKQILQPRYSLMPFHWPWAFIRFIRVVARAVVLSLEEWHVPRDSITLNAQDTDLEAQIGILPNTDDVERFPFSSAGVPSRSSEVEENV
ncbi:hypothetical protein AAF712_014288 [Marasmius tenuissimus]|uniref:Uncharacterized protein n=1 Tax=Marasmius tenuissimus TaxID=585030 RepID=A0ABR2ZEX5_9AGAR